MSKPFLNMTKPFLNMTKLFWDTLYTKGRMDTDLSNSNNVLKSQQIFDKFKILVSFTFNPNCYSMNSVILKNRCENLLSILILFKLNKKVHIIFMYFFLLNKKMFRKEIPN